MINDPYLYGQIAATNALSDVYAMGGKVITALNIVAFPEKMDMEILKQILKGGAEKVHEAGGVLAGGHSIHDSTPKYGLSVTGVVHPDKILVNNNCKEGDVLIVTKPLGVSIINSAHMIKECSEEAFAVCVKQMTTLNKYSCEVMTNYTINACTDITGFGLLGHSIEMIGNNKNISFIFDYNKIPKILNVEEYSKKGFVCGGGIRNIDFFKTSVCFSNLEEWQEFLEKNLSLYEIGKVSKREENLIIVK